MKTPKAVVFDLGKVLVDFDYNLVATRVGQLCRNGSCDLLKILGPDSTALVRFETGLIDTAGFFAEVKKAVNFSGTPEQFNVMFADIFEPIVPMVQVNKTLRAQGIPTYIFSNTNPLAVNHIRDRFPFFKDFTAYILSYEHGSMKPDSKLYEVVETTTGYRGDDILYLDDRSENVEAGTRRGWKTILHQHHDETKQIMRSHGFAV